MAVVVLVERHEEMRRLYDAWLRHQDHEVFNCPCIVGGAHGQLRCVLLADLSCPLLRQADFVVYDPWPGEEPAGQEDIEVIRARSRAMRSGSVSHCSISNVKQQPRKSLTPSDGCEIVKLEIGKGDGDGSGVSGKFFAPHLAWLAHYLATPSWG